MNARVALIVGLGLGAAISATSCWVPPLDPNDDRCDPDHGCLPGFACINGHCKPDVDAGPGQCDAFGYTCGATECLTDPCLIDGGCIAPQPLTGNNCAGGRCRNDGVCVSANVEFDCSNGFDDNNNSLADCLDPSCLNVTCNTNKCKDERCQANGDCSGAPVTCSPPPCFWPGICNPAVGCVYFPDAGAPCNDGNACFQTDLCSAIGTCVGTNPVVCSSPPPDPTCHNAGVCNQTDGGCSYALKTAGTGCDDSNGCTMGETCTAGGLCTGGSAKTCNTPPDGGVCHAASGTCTPATGLCTYAQLSGTSPTCNDNNPCTTDTCNGAGSCDLTAVANGTACTGGGITGVCFASNCVPFPYAPSNFTASGVAANPGVGGAVTINCALTFNSSGLTFTGCPGSPAPNVGTVANGGITAVVLSMSSLNITAAGSLNLTGSRPVILAVFGDATVSGTIRAGASAGGAPAGANPSACPGGAGGNGGAFGGGGGGGGFGTSGGGGGNGASNGAGSAVAANGQADLKPLRGGCAGGDGGGLSSERGQGANGGGAVQISVGGMLTLNATAVISVAGSGGGNTQKSGTSAGGGGGAGSGGGILLEGDVVSLLAGAKVTANGGGGGGGAMPNPSGQNGGGGNDGSDISITPAGGGGGGGPSDNGHGGDGAAGASGAGDGDDYGGGGGGGGGGGAGRIRVNKGNGACTISATLSPTAAVSKGPGCP